MKERSLRIAKRAGPAIAVLLAIAWMLPESAFHAKQLLPASMNTLDDSWHMELGWRLSRGEIAGRDGVFTYGPLFQLVHGGPALLFGGGAPASLIRWEYLGPGIVCGLLLWWLLAATGAPVAWRAVAVVLWPLFFPVAIKPLLAIALLAWMGRVLASTAPRPGRSALALAGVAAPVALLYAFDMGIMTFLATLALCGGAAAGASLSKAPPARALRANTAWIAGAAAAGMLLFGLLTLAGFESYLPDSWRIATGYSAKMGTLIKDAVLWKLVRGFAVGMFILAICSAAAWWEWRQARVVQAPLGALAAVAVLASAWTRYGLTRGDESHLQVALDPVTVLALLLLPLTVRSLYGLRAGGAAVALAAIAGMWLSGTTVRSAWTVARHDVGRLFSWEFSSAELEVQHAGIASAVTAARSLPGEDLYVWPWQTAVNVLAGKRNPARTLQSYVAHTASLERRTIERLGTPPAMMFAAIHLDGVPNHSRTPLIFRHLLDHYELSGASDPSFRTLRYVDEARFREEPLLSSPLSFDPADPRGLTIQFPSTVRANDLLWMTVRAGRTSMYGVRKPGRLVVTFGLEQKRGIAQPALLEQDGEAHAHLLGVVPGTDPLFFAPFSPTHEWRATERMIGVNFRWKRIDKLSTAPKRITIESLSVLRRVDAETLEMSLFAPNPVARSLLLDTR